MGVFDFDRAIDSTFNTAFNLSAKLLGAAASGAFSVIRNAATSFGEVWRIRGTELASRNNRGVWVSSSVDKKALCLNDDPKFDDTETIRDADNEPALGYLAGDSELPESLIISGGTDTDRCRALIPFIFKSQKNHMPIVIIHNSDSELEAMIAGNCKVHEIVSRKGNFCDIFAGLIPDDIVRLIYDTVEQDTPERGTEPLLRALVNVVLTKRPDACIEDVASFPPGRLRDEINSLNAQGVLTKQQYSDWLEDYDSGSCARDSVRSFLARLKDDFRSTFGTKKPGQANANIRRALKSKGIVMLDIGKGNAELAVKLIMNYLLLLDKNNHKFNVIIDDLPIAKFPEFSDLIRDRAYAISHSDFVAASLSLSRSIYSRENNAEELFHDMTRDVGVVCVFRHPSTYSCRKWSEYFGMYRKIKIQREHSRSGGLFSYNRTDSLAEHEQDLPRVRDRSISMLPDGGACVYRSEGIFIGSI